MKKSELETVTLPDGNRLTGYVGGAITYGVRQKHIYWEQPCLEQLFLPHADAIECVYDIGANIGNHTVYFATHAKKAKVFSFEPVPSTFELLKKNVEQNGLSDRVTLFQCALGAQEGSARMQVNAKGSSIANICEDGNQEVPLKRLDDMKLPPPDFVKIDVEDYELEVLKGMERTLRESSPVLWVEIFADNKDMGETHQFLSSLGYLPVDCTNPPENILFTKQELSSEEKLKELYAFTLKSQQNTWANRQEAVQSIESRYKNSRSWKITAPLRAVRSLFRRH